MTTKQDISGKDLAFKVIMKIGWFILAVAISYLAFTKSTDFFFGTLGNTSEFWIVVSGLISFGVGRVFNSLLDGAF